ncbi:MAG: hypothetical protein DWQ44_13760 [Bacteroidetes bacterium]|nr:MAG: hypothetical protein DWQ33_08570 [Bacteroidota bacterium]REK05675.1 MAG: hypothetical protein DWQ39_04485 [Bacteroidota bacterium]REK32019.1 MAG: hypothetical protein DWQ44_13760 [Bacteroidota bacterium]REK50083.1 MAG: hypothetical protein DWQ48_05980 [Bacteroidota bacterium]
MLRIDTLSFPIPDRFGHIQNDKLKFPFVRTGNEKIDTLINSDIKNRFTNFEFPDASIDSTIIAWAQDQIVYLDFSVTYSKNGFLSLNISAEGCGANCSGWTEYFTYSLHTGKYISLAEVADTGGAFRDMIHASRDIQFKNYRNELQSLLQDKDSGIDEDNFELIMEHLNDCENSFELNTYAIHADYLEISHTCYFPNIIKNMAPSIELKFKFSDIEEFLKIKL